MRIWFAGIGILTLILLIPFTILYALEETEDLLRQLQSEDPDAREEAIEILGQSQDPGLIEPLVNLLLKHKNAEVRSAAAVILFRMGNEKAREAFASALKDPDINVQLVASGALYKFGDPKALDLLATALKDPSQEVRFSAVAILADIGDAKSLELLKFALQDPNQDIRDLAQEALQELTSNLLQVVTTDNAPVIDGISDDPAWAQAGQLQVATEIKTHEGPTVTLQALRKEAKMYLLASWLDPSQTPSVHHKPWVYNGTHWEISKQEEDRLSLIFPITSIPSFSDRGCEAFCHKAGLLHTGASGELADLWIWRAARSNPVGQADDWSLDSEQNPELGGRKPDVMEVAKIKIDGVEVNRQGYTANVQKQENRPLFVSVNDKKPDEVEILLTGQVAPFNPNKKYERGDYIPGYLVAPFTGSRGDIQAKGTYKEGRWILELSRALDTGHPDDVRFEEGKDYFFSLELFDGKERASAKGVYRLRF